MRLEFLPATGLKIELVNPAGRRASRLTGALRLNLEVRERDLDAGAGECRRWRDRSLVRRGLLLQNQVAGPVHAGLRHETGQRCLSLRRCDEQSQSGKASKDSFQRGSPVEWSVHPEEKAAPVKVALDICTVGHHDLCMSAPQEKPILPSIEELPTLSAARRGRKPITDVATGITAPSSFELALKLLADGLAEGSIANARYKDAYFVLTRVLEDAWEEAVKSKFPLSGRNKAADEARYKYPYSPTFLRMERPRAEFARMRDAEQDPLTRAIHDAAVRFYDECIPLARVVLWAKAHAVKRAPAPPAPPEENLPPATQASRKLVRDALTETLEAVRAKYREQLLERYIASVEFIDSKLSTIKMSEAPNYGPPGLFYAAFDTGRDAAGKLTAHRRADWKQATEKLVDRSVSMTLRQFIEKNVEKLSAVVELKGGELPLRKLINASVSGGVLETRMSFTFPDTSSFEVRNQIVQQYSPLGRPYVRFPTTFHDVRLADGSRLSQPSELVMKTTFVGVGSTPEDDELPSPSP